MKGEKGCFLCEDKGDGVGNGLQRFWLYSTGMLLHMIPMEKLLSGTLFKMENRYGLVPRRLSLVWGHGRARALRSLCSRFVGERKSRRLRRRQEQKMSILPPQKGLGIPGDGRGLKGQNGKEKARKYMVHNKSSTQELKATANEMDPQERTISQLSRRIIVQTKPMDSDSTLSADLTFHLYRVMHHTREATKI
ncbi:uncharacterized protein LOC144662747 isoform X1 [Oculina patagonica]